mmetsp:Transcript_111357/g.359392  ORF Transcript_111357/g.359392 Transcript_111357/m.359392 type:complete len:217 (-) Transcript_111357:96-746(-)
MVPRHQCAQARREDQCQLDAQGSGVCAVTIRPRLIPPLGIQYCNQWPLHEQQGTSWQWRLREPTSALAFGILQLDLRGDHEQGAEALALALAAASCRTGPDAADGGQLRLLRGGLRPDLQGQLRRDGPMRQTHTPETRRGQLVEAAVQRIPIHAGRDIVGDVAESPVQFQWAAPSLLLLRFAAASKSSLSLWRHDQKQRCTCKPSGLDRAAIAAVC